MSFSSKMAFKYIKAQKKHSVFIVLSIASALILVTFIFTLFSSFYSTMLYNERQKYQYHAIIYDMIRTDAEKLSQSDMITWYEFAPYSSGEEEGVLYIEFRNDIYDPETFIREFAEENFEADNYNLSLHEELLEYEVIGIHAKASLAKKLVLIIAIVLFILFCARFVIDTAFEISSREKEAQFGILASLGASKSQITAIIMWQGALLSLIGIPLGLALGTVVGGLVFSYADSIGALAYFTGSDVHCTGVFSVSVLYLVIAAVVGFLWVLLSAYGTGRRYSDKSPIESVMQSNKRIIKPKKSRLSKKALGKVSGLALKNIRRDKKSFVITSLALIISYTMISLFSTFFGNWVYHHRAWIYEDMLSENIADDYRIYHYSDDNPDNDVEEMEEAYRILENCPAHLYVSSVQRCNVIVTKDSYTLRETLPFSKEYLEFNEKVGWGTTMRFYFLNRQFYDDIFAERSGISYDELVEKNGFVVCGTEGVLETYANDEKVKFEGSPLVTGGDSLSLNLYDINGKIISTNTEVNLLASIRGVGKFTTLSKSISLIGAEDCRKNLNGGVIADSDGVTEFMIGLPRDNSVSLWRVDKAFRDYLKDYPQFEIPQLQDGDTEQIIKTEQQFEPVMTLIGVVIAIITIIAFVNLINIISTGIMNRRKEIASLTSIGMTRWQLFRMLLMECVGYTVTAALIAFGIAVAATFFQNSHAIRMNYESTYSYAYAVAAPLLSALGGFIISSVTILISLKIFDRVSVAEEMKTVE